jgi:hypothetical protein
LILFQYSGCITRQIFSNCQRRFLSLQTGALALVCKELSATFVDERFQKIRCDQQKLTVALAPRCTCHLWVQGLLVVASSIAQSARDRCPQRSYSIGVEEERTPALSTPDAIETKLSVSQPINPQTQQWVYVPRL